MALGFVDVRAVEAVMIFTGSSACCRSCTCGRASALQPGRTPPRWSPPVRRSSRPAAHLTSQNNPATLSTDGAHCVVVGATHEALIADEGHSAATTQAILDVVSAVRTRRAAGQVIGMTS